jgi:hypothetical protein
VFRTSRRLVAQFLQWVYADQLFHGLLFFLPKKKGWGKKIYDGLVDTLTAAFWIGLLLMLFDVVLGNQQIFLFLDQHRWIGLAFPIYWGLRIFSR